MQHPDKRIYFKDFPNGKLWIKEQATDNVLNTYHDPEGQLFHPIPVILSAEGGVELYMDEGVKYDIHLEDAINPNIKAFYGDNIS